MKKLVILSVVAMGLIGVAHAASVGPESSWSEIRKAGLIPGFTTIFFQTEGVTIDDLCVDGKNIRPFQPLKTTCAEYDTRGDHFRCIKERTDYLTTPITHQEERCLEWDENPRRSPNCLKPETVTVDYPLNYLVSVYQLKPRAGHVEVFKKGYTIPVCQ